MNQHITSAAKRVLRSAGLEVHRYCIDSSAEARLKALLRAHRVEVVLDVGANVGQYALELRAAGYAGRIVSFEPLAAAHLALQAASRGDPSWTIAPRVAIGASEGSATLNIAADPTATASSILPLDDSARTREPGLRVVGTEQVRVATLDSLASAFIADDDRPFLKIDTQGYESQVLDGARQVLERACGVQIELSMVPIYEGQPLYREVMDRLDAEGFVLHAVFPGYSDQATGRMLQMDGVFFRETAGRP
jgi:FkbM family methyltransferase